MRVHTTSLLGVLIFAPERVHHDDRGFMTRTFDAGVGREHGVDPAVFLQDSQSRSRHGVVRGLHGRAGRGESKLVRCARGAVHDVVVDARSGSPTLGRSEAFRLDDEMHRHLYLPPGVLHGFQVLTGEADICYRIDRAHEPAEDLAVRFDDPDLGVEWPLEVSVLSPRDEAAGSWKDLLARVAAEPLRA